MSVASEMSIASAHARIRHSKCWIGYGRQRIAAGEGVNQRLVQSAIPRFYNVLGFTHAFFNLKTRANTESSGRVLFSRELRCLTPGRFPSRYIRSLGINVSISIIPGHFHFS
jgi:hypothetical protein